MNNASNNNNNNNYYCVSLFSFLFSFSIMSQYVNMSCIVDRLSFRDQMSHKSFTNLR